MRHILSRLFVLAALPATLMVACVHAGLSGGSASNQLLVTDAELLGTTAPDLYEALHRERPWWFGAARPVQNVFIMDQWIGTTDVLRDLTPNCVASVRLLSESEVTLRYGSRFSGRGLMLIMRAS